MLSSNGKTTTHTDTPFHGVAPKTPEQILAEARALVESLEKKLARGTRDVTPDVPREIPKPAIKPPEFGERAEQVLRSKIVTTDELSKLTGEKLDKVQAWIKANRSKRSDIGTPAQAKWLWKVGDDGTAKDLQA